MIKIYFRYRIRYDSCTELAPLCIFKKGFSFFLSFPFVVVVVVVVAYRPIHVSVTLYLLIIWNTKCGGGGDLYILTLA